MRGFELAVVVLAVGLCVAQEPIRVPPCEKEDLGASENVCATCSDNGQELPACGCVIERGLRAHYCLIVDAQTKCVKTHPKIPTLEASIVIIEPQPCYKTWECRNATGGTECDLENDCHWRVTGGSSETGNVYHSAPPPDACRRPEQ